MKLNDLIPMLSASDVEKSLDFYRDILGFELDTPESKFEEDGTLLWCSIRSGDVRMMLTACHTYDADNEDRRVGRGSIVFYYYPDDVMALWQSLKDKGYDVGETRVTFYQNKEFQMQDPVGHTLWFGQHTDKLATDCE